MVNSDLTNKIFGRLTVTRNANKSNSRRDVYWDCRCICGKDVVVKGANLRGGITKSCGCFQRDIAANLRKLEFPWEANRTYLINDYKQRAKKKGLKFELSIEDCEKIFKGDCGYCGIAPYKIKNQYIDVNGKTKYVSKNTRLDLNAASYLYNGIDRVNNNLGYLIEQGQCVPCCEICNRAKWHLSLKDWQSYLRRLISFQNTSKVAKALPVESIIKEQHKSLVQLIRNYKRWAVDKILTSS